MTTTTGRGQTYPRPPAHHQPPNPAQGGPTSAPPTYSHAPEWKAAAGATEGRTCRLAAPSSPRLARARRESVESMLLVVCSKPFGSGKRRTGAGWMKSPAPVCCVRGLWVGCVRGVSVFGRSVVVGLPLAAARQQRIESRAASVRVLMIVGPGPPIRSSTRAATTPRIDRFESMGSPEFIRGWGARGFGSIRKGGERGHGRRMHARALIAAAARLSPAARPNHTGLSQPANAAAPSPE